MYKVTINQKDNEQKIINVNSEDNLLTVLRDNSVYIKSSCGGVASCSDCIFRVKDGDDHLNTPTFEELKLIGNVFHITKERLACQTKISGDIEIDLSMHNKEDDDASILSKTKAFKKSPVRSASKTQVRTKVRKKDEIVTILEERQEGREERKTKQDSWFKHWEKGAEQKKNMGGSKRPKEFRTDNIEFGQEAENTAIKKAEGIKSSLEKREISAKKRAEFEDKNNKKP